MSTPILPFAVWSAGTNQNSIPANDNSLRAQILNGEIIADDVTAQPDSPSDGDTYIIPDGATGAQWALFEEFDLAIYQSGTWYAYAPVDGIRVTVADQLMRWDGSEYVVLGGLSDAPEDGETYGRKDGDWVQVGGSIGDVRPIRNITDQNYTIDPETDKSHYLRHSYAGAKTVVFDGDNILNAAEEYWLFNAASSGDLTITAANGTTFKGGSLVIAPGDAALVKMTSFNDADVVRFGGGGGSDVVTIGVACSDETTAITAGAGKVTFRMPHAMTLTAVRATLTTAQASGNIFTVDINKGGTSILSTKLTIDNTEKTSTTAVAGPVISDSSLADDAEITVDVDQIGDGTAKGLKVWLIGTRA